ncbi:hypothetical protein F511_35062 [Dorcoceras hygrometricum]|uniref:Uncharacterized protein n=1 Tax=Dorcoceras hygrometricum TaxID=472368 RepID=A0A2Z7AFJ1_9LAMI|nr:hypothetical protein F511_35062 [Dorcoceras hygrometricum]
MFESGSDTDEEIVAAKATGTDTVMGAADIVDTEELSLAKDVATMTEFEDTGSEGNDLWQRLPKQTVPPTIELSPQWQFDDTLAPVSEFFKVLHTQWADVCIEVVQSSTVGSLQPVGSHNFCRDIVAVSTVIDIAVDASDFVGVFGRGTNVHMILSESSSSSSGSAHPDPTVFASISQRPLDTDLTSPNPSTTDSRVFFTTDDTPMGVDQILMPTTVTPQYFTEPLAQLRALVNQISTERVNLLPTSIMVMTKRGNKVPAAVLNRLLMIRIDPAGEVRAEVVALVEVVEEMTEGVLRRKGDPVVVVVVDLVLLVDPIKEC